jgi:hypothetical protein
MSAEAHIRAAEACSRAAALAAQEAQQWATVAQLLYVPPPPPATDPGGPAAVAPTLPKRPVQGGPPAGMLPLRPAAKGSIGVDLHGRASASCISKSSAHAVSTRVWRPASKAPALVPSPPAQAPPAGMLRARAAEAARGRSPTKRPRAAAVGRPAVAEHHLRYAADLPAPSSARGSADPVPAARPPALQRRPQSPWAKAGAAAGLAAVQANEHRGRSQVQHPLGAWLVGCEARHLLPPS